MRFPLLLAGLAVFLLTGCDKISPDAASQPGRDENLRRYLNINSIHGTFKLPVDTRAYFPIIFVVQDGQVIDRKVGILSGVDATSQDREPVACELLWRGKGDAASPFQDFVLLVAGGTSPLPLPKGLDQSFSTRGNISMESDEQFRFEDAQVGAIFQGTSANVGMRRLSSEAMVLAEKDKTILILALAHSPDYAALEKRFMTIGR